MKEKELCVSLGISREQLKAIRAAATEGLHYTRIESKKPKHLWEVRWTENGVHLVQSSLGMNPVEEKVERVGEKRGTVYCKYQNPRVLGVLIDGKQENVLCRDSGKFGIGMNVDIRWDGSRWVVSRHPRFVGKY